MSGEGRRRLQLVRRAERQAETRRRITEATVELHGTVGPARTQISEIARRAGVQRLTVYNHFPDEHALFRACSSHHRAQRPMPDRATWQQVEDPAARVGVALAALYAHYESDERMLANVIRDAATMPALRAVLEGGLLAYLGAVRGDLLAGWDAPPAELAAFLELALSFEAWQRLSGSGLPAAEAAALMTRAALAVAAGESLSASPPVS